ncbi:MAG: Crp/Fnr family transcriptional regulator [Myxococcota bacterium]
MSDSTPGDAAGPARTDERPPAGRSDSRAYLNRMDRPHARARGQTACPDCPATRLSVFEALVFDGTCRFRCLALPARRAVPGAWFASYGLGLIRRGVLIRQRVDRQGRVTAVDAAGPGCMVAFADPGGPGTSASVSTGYAATDVLVCLCPRETLERALEGSDISRDMIAMQQAALERVERLADARGRSSAESRVAAVLCTLADTLSPPRQRHRIPADFQQRDIANLAGIRHETVCRTLGDLERRGAVKRDTDGLQITDREQLETL